MVFSVALLLCVSNVIDFLRVLRVLSERSVAYAERSRSKLARDKEGLRNQKNWEECPSFRKKLKLNV